MVPLTTMNGSSLPSVRISRLGATVALSVALVLVGAAAPAAAQGVARAPGQADRGASTGAFLLHPTSGNQWSVFSAYGVNQEINRSAVGIDLATAGVRWSHLWHAKGAGFFRGHPGLALEFLPLMGFIGSAQTTWGFGGNILYEHHFAASGRVLPIWQIGAGILYADRPVTDRGTRRNFSLLTSFGVDIAITHRSAVYLGYRFHHVSNANTAEFNPGINVHQAVFGLSFYR